jgi:predicted NACHT family NTPase
MANPKIIGRAVRAIGTGGLLVALGGLSYWQWDRIVAHPVVSSLIAAGAAILASLLGFGKKVRQKLEEKWVDSTADWIDAQVRLYGSLLFSGFRRRYFRQLRYRHRVFNVRGLRTQGVFTLELEKVFVDLQVAPKSLQRLSRALLRAEDLSGKKSIWELLMSRHSAFRILAVIGPPGSGKTTLLQHLALVFVSNQQSKHRRRCRAFVPILLFLRSHVDTIAAKDPPTLAELVTDFEEKEGLKPPMEWFERKLRKGKALVLLDGLDEVADTTKRRAVIEWVAKQIECYGEARFIVTSRPHGYRTNPLPVATVVEVQPFTLEQVKRFVNSWYLANEVLGFGKDDAGVRQDAVRKAQDLLQRLQNAPTLVALAVNPLLLTMIAMVHRYRGALPGRRVELYGEICDVLLGHWQAAKGLTAQLSPAQCRAVLQPLAFHLMTEKKREVASVGAQEVIQTPLVSVQGPAANAKAFLKELERASGLLLERETDIYSFSHLTFQEYLASTHLLENHNTESLLPNVDDPWWHETIRLYAAQSDATSARQLRRRGKAPSFESFILHCRDKLVAWSLWLL